MPEDDQMNHTTLDRCPDGFECINLCRHYCFRVLYGSPSANVFHNDRWPNDVIDHHKMLCLEANQVAQPEEKRTQTQITLDLIREEWEAPLRKEIEDYETYLREARVVITGLLFGAAPNMETINMRARTYLRWPKNRDA